eukprot:14490089-Alexandrium_andersonii.AAC.1
MGIHVLSKACTAVQPQNNVRASDKDTAHCATKCASHPNAHATCKDIASIQHGAPSLDAHNTKNTMQHAPRQ